MINKKINKIFLMPWVYILIGILPWWLLDKFLMKGRLYIALFDNSKNKFISFLTIFYIVMVIINLAVERIPEENREEKAGLLFGKFFVGSLWIQVLILIIVGLIGVISFVIK